MTTFTFKLKGEPSAKLFERSCSTATAEAANALNLRIGELLEYLNDRSMKKLGCVNRLQAFRATKKRSAAAASTLYEYADWR